MSVPTQIDFLQLRNDRQKHNNQVVFDAINEKNMETIMANTNPKAIERVIIESNHTSLEHMIETCNSDDIHQLKHLNKRLLSMLISKTASRQGCRDETTQIQVCHNTCVPYNIYIENLNVTDFRPTKNGRIISKETMKDEKITKDQCLKSFDGRITGSMNGWIFAKVVFTSGGHQDNVFEEADTLCAWVETYKKDTTEIYVILIDTDLTTKCNVLKEKYKHVSNIWIVNHVEFQQKIMDIHTKIGNM